MSSPLLLKPHFLAYFSTQFLGAFNDNVFKNGLTLSIIYNIHANSQEQGLLLVNIAAALFILPFILFSPIAGQLAQNSEKSQYIQRIKLIEIIIMILAAILFMLQNVTGLLLVLFLMGTQSTFFGPVKYSILPLMLKKNQLYQANALVEAGTFIAILLGLFLSAFIINSLDANIYISLIIIALAILGYLSARYIPIIEESNFDNTPINLNIIKEIKNQWSLIQTNSTLKIIMLGISWFWFIGASYMTQLPAYVKIHIHAQATVYSALLILFSLGIGFGSLSSKFFNKSLSLKSIVLIGLLGMNIFGILFSLLPSWPQTEMLSFSQFLDSQNAILLISYITLIGISGGWFIVPLYTLLQLKTEDHNRSKMVASNNVLNAILMVLSAILAIVLISLGFSIAQLFLIFSIASFAILWQLKNKLTTDPISQDID